VSTGPGNFARPGARGRPTAAAAAVHPEPRRSGGAAPDSPGPPAGPQAPPSPQSARLSIVVPLFNEEESVHELHRRLAGALEPLGDYEILLVDDGSTDGTFAALSRIAAEDRRTRVIQLRRNCGQTAAMAAGFDYARGDVIIPMDGDLQNDPADIPLLLAKIAEGYDVASGWRKNRKDEALRKAPSRLANWLISKVTGVRLHDYGCTMKAYRSEIVKGTHLYGEMHRFIPALASLMGARICEVPVTHHPRRFGRSKYGLRRTFKVLLDLLTVKFLADYSTKPLYLFGGVGVLLCGGGVLAGIETLWEKFFRGTWVHRNPMILVAVFLFSLGVNFILMGLLAEMIVRTYHESQAKPIYWVRSVLNVEED
jgi:glycosyltransferase involved in cell wall biosynthesis